VKKPLGITPFLLQGREEEGRRIAKVATARKLLEWVYHILTDGKTYQEMEKIADLLGRGEPGNSPGSA
jgi:hypothetical protein